MTLGEFKARSIVLHNNKYDYSKIIWGKSKDKIEIICPIHGSFWMLNGNHLKKQGCPTCGRELNTKKTRHNLETLIQQSKEIHGADRYNYSLTEYVTYTSCKKITLICNACGITFDILPTNHIHKKAGCMCNVKGGYDDKYFIVNPDKKNIDSTLYHIKIYNNEECFNKIGITTRTIVERFKKLEKYGYQYEIISEVSMPLYDAYCHEQKFLEHRHNRYFPKVKFDGWTECYKE